MRTETATSLSSPRDFLLAERMTRKATVLPACARTHLLSGRITIFGMVGLTVQGAQGACLDPPG